MKPNIADEDSGVAPPVMEDREAEGQVRMATAMQRLHHGHLIYVPGVGWHFWDTQRWRIDELERSSAAAIVDSAVLRPLVGGPATSSVPDADTDAGPSERSSSPITGASVLPARSWPKPRSWPIPTLWKVSVRASSPSA